MSNNDMPIPAPKFTFDLPPDAAGARIYKHSKAWGNKLVFDTTKSGLENASLVAKQVALEARAERNYPARSDFYPDGVPHSDHNRREWIRAIAVVRSTKRGWRLDNPITEKQPQQ